MEPTEIGIILTVIVLYSIFFLKKPEAGVRALKYSFDTALDVFFLLTFGIAIVGLMMVLIPENIVIVHLGMQTGVWGIVLGVAIGAVLPSGGYIRLPVVLALLTLGAGVGTVVAILATRSLLYIPQSIAFFGVRVECMLTLSFLLCGFSAGIFAHFLTII
jgi:uncharacterized membrane protein YraQ (UPF0718 family)